MSVNSWGTDKKKSYDDMVKDTLKYGPLRVNLAVSVVPILNESKLIWYLDTGNLMGAYRDGKMLKHDDDFDIGLYAKEDEFNKLFELLKEQLDERYKVRLIDTYCKKIEVYDESHGSYMLDESKGYNYHNVTVDIQLYVPSDNGNVDFMYTKNDLNKYVNIKHDMIVPVKLIEYEGYQFNCPNDPKEYLTAHYGYIGPNAVFNNKTRKYEPR